VPFPDADNATIVTFVAGGGRPTIRAGDIPPEYLQLMQQCWAQEPTRRPGFSFIVQRLGEMLARRS
jgi:hypothetical protein